MSVTYTAVHPWNRSNPGAPAVNRPYAEVVLTGPSASPRIWCLVDSGADRTQLHRSFAKAAGLTATGTQTVNTAAGGRTVVDVHNCVTLQVEGNATTELCFFGNNSIQILGRITFLNTFSNVGFDASGWMYR